MSELSSQSFEQFTADAKAQGYDECLVREWAPHHVFDTHEHPFDTNALVVQGEFWLTIDGQTRHFKKGDRFQVAHGVVHAEKYGPEGATFWAARLNPKS